MNSGCCKVSISLEMDSMSSIGKCLILDLTCMSGSRKVLLEGGVVGLYVVLNCCLLRGAWRIAGIKGSDKDPCLFSNVY